MDDEPYQRTNKSHEVDTSGLLADVSEAMLGAPVHIRASTHESGGACRLRIRPRVWPASTDAARAQSTQSVARRLQQRSALIDVDARRYPMDGETEFDVRIPIDAVEIRARARRLAEARPLVRVLRATLAIVACASMTRELWEYLASSTEESGEMGEAGEAGEAGETGEAGEAGAIVNSTRAMYSLRCALDDIWDWVRVSAFPLEDV
jgi:hypothetical protein